MEKIKNITQEEDIDMLVKKFIEVEDKNFALFNYVNEQNNQIEDLQNEITEVCIIDSLIIKEYFLGYYFCIATEGIVVF